MSEPPTGRGNVSASFDVFHPGPFCDDYGQTLPLTASALQLLRENNDPNSVESAGHVEEILGANLGELFPLKDFRKTQLLGRVQKAITGALSTERLLLPAPFNFAQENSGDENNEPDSQNANDSCHSQSLITQKTSLGRAVVAFSSVEQLTVWRSQARPVPMDSARVALVALASGGGKLLLDPKGSAILLGRPSLTALASGDTWMPPWEDEELIGELKNLVAQVSVCDRSLKLLGVMPQLAGGIQLLIEMPMFYDASDFFEGHGKGCDVNAKSKLEAQKALGELDELLQHNERLHACAAYTILLPFPSLAYSTHMASSL